MATGISSAGSLGELALPCAFADTEPESVYSYSLRVGDDRLRVPKSVDDSSLIALRGNVHPMTRKQFDTGVAQALLAQAKSG
jgi:hypothetical protein